MRWSRFLLVGGVVAGLLLLPSAASAAEIHVGIHSMTCNGILAHGDGMPRRAVLVLTVVDQDNGKTLARQQVRTSAKGDFLVPVKARLNMVLGVRLKVSRPDGSPIGFADHTMEKGAPMCDLPFTGPARAGRLLGVGGACVGVGVLLLVVAGRRRPAARG